MPSIDVEGKAWQMELSARVGKAVQRRRKALKLTAQQLAQRTVELGYPVTRVAISKIESNVRAGKLDIAEWLVLSQALEIPPAVLLYPDYPEGPVQGLPGRENESVAAVWWISGRRARHAELGADLVGLVEQRAELMWEANKLDSMLMTVMIATPKGSGDAEEKALKQRIRSIEEQLVILDDDIRRAKSELWGES